MNEVTLSWSAKNFITINLMVLVGGAVLVAVTQAVKAAQGKNS